MESNLFVGSRIRLTSIQNIGIDPRTKMTHKPEKGKVYVAIVIGVEEKTPQTEDDILQGKEAIKRLRKVIKEEVGDDIIPGEITSIQGLARF